MTATIFELLQKPFLQVLLFLLLTILSVFISKPGNADATWVRAGYGFIGFMLVNSILICTVPESWSYFFYSLGFSVAYFLCVGILVSVIIKILKLEGTEESAMIFLFIIYHPVFLLVMLFFKWVYFKLF